ncbi:MAG TPA: hypothetical protein VE954_43275 [Oligoflexus sp.]|uniref:hypothetical protein n=1 Tax=Oligoflexus sp. TaxID=1971216 RepID=UPI002D31B0DE|nr:hypothetical protein [Oligoflexus sp.]HYX39967.1 hypothetical protein [Oligoflexus sp.]
MKVLIRNAKSFGTLAFAGVHQIVDSERDIDNAVERAVRDGFKSIIFYFSYPSNWVTNHDFRSLVSEARAVPERLIADESEVASYLEQWRDNDNLTDFNLMLDRGLALLALDFIVGAGAIEEVDMESSRILRWYEANHNDKQLDSERRLLLSGCEVWIDKHNQHAFIDSDDTWVTQTELMQDGYAFSSRYDRKGKRRKTSQLPKN